jgi:uncharacterized Zn-finger protein
MFFLLIGNRYMTKGAGTTDEVVQCPSCGATGRFERKSGRQYLTLFFLLPVLPLGGRQTFVECPACKTRFAGPESVRRAA